MPFEPSSYKVIFDFESKHEMEIFLHQQQQLNAKKDNRGSKTRFLHQKTKEFHFANPDVPYRDCLKHIGMLIKAGEIKQDTEDELTNLEAEKLN